MITVTLPNETFQVEVLIDGFWDSDDSGRPDWYVVDGVSLDFGELPENLAEAVEKEALTNEGFFTEVTFVDEDGNFTETAFLGNGRYVEFEEWIENKIEQSDFSGVL